MTGVPFPCPASGSRRLPLLSRAFALVLVLMAVLLALLLLRALGAAMQGADFNADAWTILDLSRHLTPGEGFYRVGIVRQYNLALDHGSSYGFLAPGLLALANALSDAGIYGLFFLMAAAGAALPVPLATVLRKSGAPPLAAWTGAFSLFALALAIPEFFADLFRASTIPLSALLLTMMLALLPAAGAMTLARAALLGLLGGLAALNRFDVNLYVGAFTLVVAAAASGGTGRRLSCAGLYALALGLTLSPWIVYSLLVFGRPYVSDNSAVALAVDRFYVTDLIPAARATVFTDPAGWLARVVANAADTGNLLAGMWSAGPIAPVLTLAALLLGAVVLGCAGKARVALRLPRYAKLVALSAVLSWLLLVGPVLTGYQENIRYFSITILLVMLAVTVLLGAAAWPLAGAAGPRASAWPARLLLAGLLGAFALVLGPLAGQTDALGPAVFALKDKNQRLGGDGDPTAEYLRCLPAGARVFMLYPYDNPKLADSLRFGAMSDRMVFLMPGNWRRLPLADKRAFLRDARLSHLVLDESRPTGDLVDPAMGLVPVPQPGCPGVYTLPLP
ncbi:hypothetical protein E6C67_03525 (plasmid) [Azospirillum sp. TSA2s]|uniref:hypothetical protein n=1 Tax=Azospirillum sp. TSA2s TaxID=709810 RepID=UPI0010AA6902|nr:hypothetical protein [Azospirillum sp. TSA2s]QCG93029.1 hypothetical protein E6C67_03525 [Azospirillum sp. TSA2s]